MTSLLIGLLLVGEAALAIYFGMRELGIGSFALAAAAIVAGLIGLAMTLAHERRQNATQPGTSRPKVYRQTPCQVERPLVEKLSKAVKNLKQQIKEKQWEMDWPAFQQHEDLGEKLVGENKLTEGFAEYCRAMRLLAETVQRYRPRGAEGFNPLWER